MSRLLWDVNRCCINVNMWLYNIISMKSIALGFGKSPKTLLNLIRISMEDYVCGFVFSGIRNKQVLDRNQTSGMNHIFWTFSHFVNFHDNLSISGFVES